MWVYGEKVNMIREFVSTVFIVDKGKVLLNFNNNCKVWVPIGGHIEKDDLPCDTVIREAKEETGLDIELVSSRPLKNKHEIVQPFDLRLDHVRDDHKHINITYFGIVKGGKYQEIADDGAPSKWFTKEELEKIEMPENVKEWAIKALEHLG
jgi:8-oxo-dGTP pyrophosphatase MutT (NUDIX family)